MFGVLFCSRISTIAEVEELVDSLSSEGSFRKEVWVRVPPSAPQSFDKLKSSTSS